MDLKKIELKGDKNICSPADLDSQPLSERKVSNRNFRCFIDFSYEIFLGKKNKSGTNP